VRTRVDLGENRGYVTPVLRIRPLLFVLFTVIALLAAATAGLCILLYTDWGHARVCAALNAGVSSGIAGRLEVQGIDELALGSVRAHGIKILAPDGKPAIEADSAVIDYDFAQLWQPVKGWARADIEHCLVHVTEDPDGRINMEKTFAAPKKSAPESDAKSKSDGELDLKQMVTSDCKLIISGGSMPTLRMEELSGIMRVHVLPSGKTELRFDTYRGKFVDGLPTGQLDFQAVSGEVKTEQAQLLHFEGRGQTHGSDVKFGLVIDTEPKKKLVRIDATFAKVSPASIIVRTAELWSVFKPGLQINVHQED